MAAKKRMVWRISDIVGAAVPGRRRTAEEYCVIGNGNVPSILERMNVTLPLVVAVTPHVWGSMSTDERAAALVATAKRLRVPMVPA